MKRLVRCRNALSLCNETLMFGCKIELVQNVFFFFKCVMKLREVQKFFATRHSGENHAKKNKIVLRLIRQKKIKLSLVGLR